VHAIALPAQLDHLVGVDDLVLPQDDDVKRILPSFSALAVSVAASAMSRGSRIERSKNRGGVGRELALVPPVFVRTAASRGSMPIVLLRAIVSILLAGRFKTSQWP
jgi:hypothetical protein